MPSCKEPFFSASFTDSSMAESSVTDKEPSESELNDYKRKSYEALKNGNYRVRISEEEFTCPYCHKKRKRDFSYKDLFQHAAMVGICISERRTAKDKANHLALAEYLKNDLADAGSPSKSVAVAAPMVPSNHVAGDDPLLDCDQAEKFAWPWAGIVVNLPTVLQSNGFYGGQSGSKLRDELAVRGFNPTRVLPLWNYIGHSGNAVVEFSNNWLGLHNAMSFERAYEVDHHGKKDWEMSNGTASGLYGWVARGDDYNDTGIIGDHLLRSRDLRALSEIKSEEAHKSNKLVSKLEMENEDKSNHLKKMEREFIMTSLSLTNLIDEKDKLLHSYNEEIKVLQQCARAHYQKIFSDHEKLKLQLESQKNELELRAEELEKREAKNEIEKKKIFEEIEMNVLRNSTLQLASLEQEKADENVLKLAEHQKKERERLQQKIFQLENQLDKKQELELEIERLNGMLNVMKHMEDYDDADVMKKVEETLKLLREKEADLEDLEALNQTLFVKQRMSNVELQDARKELVNGLQDISGHTHIGLKCMGEFDKKPFHEAIQRKYPGEDVEEQTLVVCSLWEEYLKDSGWHPFKIIKVDWEANPKEVINENDERLRGLRDDLGDEAYKAVATALLEINEYNASGRYVFTELWNHTEGRVATLKEGVSLIIDRWKATRKRQRMS